MDKRIVYTRHSDGGVSVCCPTDWIMSVMCNGGFWIRERGFADRQIASMVGRGINENVAHRYARAAQFGGCTTAEALEIIRDRDCTPHGTGVELWDSSDIPADRWFRAAWSRSHNGGPIYVDLKKAKPIQMGYIGDAIFEENMRRQRKLKAPFELDRDWLRGKIRQARDENELRSIWPNLQATRSRSK